MKFRVIDFFQCSCGSTELSIEDPNTVKTDFNYKLSTVKCQNTCGLKKCSIEHADIEPQDCTECYTQDVVEGTIRCECGREYPIMRGIPRFLPERMEDDFKKIQNSFSYEWKMFRFGERNWGQDIHYRKYLFLKGMGAVPSDLEGKLIFDAGCGSGLLSMEMANSFGMEVLALDLAFGIEKAYEHNKNPFVHFVQGSVLEPPFRGEVFDYLYCAGVLVALPDSRTGFLKIIRTLRKGGRCFIWVYHPINRNYHPNDKTKLMAYNFIRQYITSPLPISVQYYVYLSLMPAFLFKQLIETILGVKKNTLSWKEKMQALFDMFSPIYQNRHTHEEVIVWFQSEGFSDICIADKGPWGFGTRGDLC